MRKIFALFVSVLVMASCTDPFDATAIWDKLNELENKNEDIENDVNGSGGTNNGTGIPDEVANNKIYYTTADGKKLFPNNTEPAAFGAILVSNIYENGVGVLTFDDDITSIGSSAFGGCSGLTSITISNSVTSIGKRAFYDCSGLTNIEIPNSVTSIGEEAFLNCSGLTSITIPNSVTSIGGYAFENCSGLTRVVIGNSVTSIGNCAFVDCSGLTSVEFNATNCTSIGRPILLAFEGCTSLSIVTIGENVKNIPANAFRSCSGLTSITIPNSVTSIGNTAFSGCSGLESIVVDPGNTKYDSRENCNAIIETESNTLIAGCKNTVIPNSVTSIGSYAFENCSGLTSVTIPNSVTSIGDYAFDRCSGLKEVHITDLDAWKNISFADYYANPLNNSNAKLYLNGVEVK